MTKFLSAELNLIQNPNLREFTEQCCDQAPEYFWVCPASLSGKYHPQVSLGPRGLLRHTKLAVWWGVEFCKAFALTPELQDYVVAALILHDMYKNGSQEQYTTRITPSNTTAIHGIWMAERLVMWGQGSSFDLDLLVTAVRGHMGVWTEEGHAAKPNNLTGTQRLVAWIVHLADYAASRKVEDITNTLLEVCPTEVTND